MILYDLIDVIACVSVTTAAAVTIAATTVCLLLLLKEEREESGLGLGWFERKKKVLRNLKESRGRAEDKESGEVQTKRSQTLLN
jgi:hypothetical protein